MTTTSSGSSVTVTPTKPPRKRERPTSLTLTIPGALAAKLAASAKANVRTPAQQAVFILLRHYETAEAWSDAAARSDQRDARLPVYPKEPL